MNNPRVEAVARIIRESDVMPGNLRPPLDLYIGDAQQALINADQADREQGIHRVKVDDLQDQVNQMYDSAEFEERMRGANVTSIRLRQFAGRIDVILAALTGSES